MNELLTRAKSQSLNDEEYQVAYSKTGELAARLKTITDRAKDIANKTNHPVLTDRVNRLSAISKEALPGHEIVVPKDLTELKKRAVRRDC